MSVSHSLGNVSRMARLGALLVTALLVVAAVACDGSDTYELSISSTSGGSVTSPGEGAFSYDAATVVQLVATADNGYRFEEWTGDIQDLTDPDSHNTTVTMRGDYFITASFRPIGEPGPILP